MNPSEVLRKFLDERTRELFGDAREYAPPPSISLEKFNRAMEPILQRAAEMARELKELS